MATEEKLERLLGRIDQAFDRFVASTIRFFEILLLSTLFMVAGKKSGVPVTTLIGFGIGGLGLIWVFKGLVKRVSKLSDNVDNIFGLVFIWLMGALIFAIVGGLIIIVAKSTVVAFGRVELTS